MSSRGGSVTWLALVLALACGKVDQTSGDGGTPSQGNKANGRASAACANYCDSVMSACIGENAVYINDEACLAVCALLEPGEPGELTGNTVACRTAHASLAEAEPADYCAGAGPGGNDQCGSDCEAYCVMYPQVCPDEAEGQATESCLEKCAALVDQPGFDLVGDHGGDTVECRLVHLASASLHPTDHCQHAQLAPTQPWCVAEQ
jgi:hypothetical protein